MRLAVVAILAATAAYAADSPKPAPSEWRAQQRAAAEKSEVILRQTEKVKGLLAQYQIMRAAYHSDGSKAFRLIFGQYLSWHQTYLGLYQEARASFSIKQEPTNDDGPSPLNTEYSPQPAIEAIPKFLKDQRAVFFNEAHNAPVTRTLTVPLLAKLRAEGFETFAAETLYETDKDLQKRGYPVGDSGFYTQEPVYAEMVRTALKLGFRVVAYEAISDATGDAREREQARNLYERVFKHDPKARLVVNAGYAHIVEKGKYLGGKSMAQHFRDFSGIDPVTVEQTMLIEHSIMSEDHPYYRAALATLHPTQPLVFADKTGKPWSLKPGGYDISVLFPPDELAEGRPTWLALGGLRKRYPVTGEICRGAFPCLIEARYIAESEDAIPADRIVLGFTDKKVRLAERSLQSGAQLRSSLYLKPGRYRLSATDVDRQSLSSVNINVGGTEKDGKP